jgi:Flp pilus assembly protein TadB
MGDRTSHTHARVKLLSFWAWIALCAVAAIVVLIVHLYTLLILVALVFIAPIILLSRDGGFWQWTNSQPKSFRDWLRR